MIDIAGSNHFSRDAHGECPIRAGSNPHPDIGFPRQCCRPRIDHDELRTVTPPFANRIGLRKPSVRRVRSPQQDHFGILIVGRRHTAAKREDMRDILMPVTNLSRITDVRTTE